MNALDMLLLIAAVPMALWIGFEFYVTFFTRCEDEIV